ncbi:MAG: ATP-binding protein [Oscillospiraceae bacterium]|jgi:hypothetical protein|nr:ATP-binding protein [Oscillospiraceae bacterium]
MEKAAPKRIAAAVLNSLKGGVVPRVGLEYIAVGRGREIGALLRDMEIIADGGATFRFLVGRYGAGKSFLLQTLRNYVMEKGFAVMDCDLSPERRFSGTKGQGLATYRELLRNLSTRAKPDGGALPLILERWLSRLQSEVAAETGLPEGPVFDDAVRRKIFLVMEEVEGMVNGFDFARAIVRYWEAHRTGDDGGKSDVLRWLRGEYQTRTEAKQALGINFIVTDENWYDVLKLFAVFLVRSGYSGLLLLVDELVNLFRIPHRVTRQYNYEKILTIYNDVLQGKAGYLGVLMSATPQCMEDSDKGIFSYDALRSRLTEGRFSAPGARDMLAPIIRLDPLSYEEMLVLTEKLAALHAGLYGTEQLVSQEEAVAFLKLEYERVGAESHITPREVIRDFIELLDIASQRPGCRVGDILRDGGFTASAPAPEDAALHQEFAEFEL